MLGNILTWADTIAIIFVPFHPVQANIYCSRWKTVHYKPLNVLWKSRPLWTYLPIFVTNPVLVHTQDWAPYKSNLTPTQSPMPTSSPNPCVLQMNRLWGLLWSPLAFSLVQMAMWDFSVFTPLTPSWRKLLFMLWYPSSSPILSQCGTKITNCLLRCLITLLFCCYKYLLYLLLKSAFNLNIPHQMHMLTITLAKNK